MSERGGEHPHEDQTFTAEVESAAFEPIRQHAMSQHEGGHVRESGEFVLVDEGRLSAEQRRVAEGLHRLYQSLCGAIPGQYWPQALLDSAGNFNRPPFPSRHPKRDSEK